jgi:hypothetical protein
MSNEPSLHDDAILKGRLALALVSERAGECPNKACARKRQCLARWGQNFNFHKPTGDCPNMTESEWRIVGFGMSCVEMRLRAEVRAMDDAEYDRIAALPLAERRRAQAAWRKEIEAEEAAKRARGEPRHPYAVYLWLQSPVEKREIVATGRKLIENMAYCGCRCAAERRMDVECIRGECRYWDARKERAAERAGAG